MTEMQFDNRVNVLGLRGPFVDQIGRDAEALIPGGYIISRLHERRGTQTGSFIPIINNNDIRSLIPFSKPTAKIIKKGRKRKTKPDRDSKRLAVLEMIRRKFGDASEWERPIDLGMGVTYSRRNHECFHRIIFWPFGNKIRRSVGLSARPSFPLIVGYSERVVSGYKGPATSVCLQPDASCSENAMNRLISFVPFFADDQDFIDALYRTCFRLEYYKQAAWLTTLCNAY